MRGERAHGRHLMTGPLLCHLAQGVKKSQTLSAYYENPYLRRIPHYTAQSSHRNSASSSCDYGDLLVSL